jgi:hypothetical protein
VNLATSEVPDTITEDGVTTSCPLLLTAVMVTVRGDVDVKDTSTVPLLCAGSVTEAGALIAQASGVGVGDGTGVGVAVGIGQ